LNARQAALHPTDLPVAPTLDPAWVLVEEGFTLAREHELESLFAIGNGYAGSRGSLAEGSALSSPATFLAGVFDSEAGPVSGLAPTADWTPALRAWQLAEPGNSCACGGSPWRCCAGGAPFPASI